MSISKEIYVVPRISYYSSISTSRIYTAKNSFLCNVGMGGGHPIRNMLPSKEFYAVLGWVEGIRLEICCHPKNSMHCWGGWRAF